MASGAPKSANLNGRISIDRLSFTNEFDLAKFLDQFGGPTSLRARKGFTQNVKVNVSVQSTEELSLSSRTLSLESSADLRVVGSVAAPVVVGRATMTRGELFFQGNRYEIERGVIDFVNPARTQPVLNMAVTTTVNQYNLSVNFAGPLDRLRTTYSSDPPLPPVDIINLLAFGKTSAAATTGTSGPTALGAESILAQGLAGKASGQIAPHWQPESAPNPEEEKCRPPETNRGTGAAPRPRPTRAHVSGTRSICATALRTDRTASKELTKPNVRFILKHGNVQ